MKYSKTSGSLHAGVWQKGAATEVCTQVALSNVLGICPGSIVEIKGQSRQSLAASDGRYLIVKAHHEGSHWLTGARM